MAILGRKGFSLLFLGALIFGLGLILLYSDQGFRQLDRLRQEKQNLQEANRELAEENRRLMLQLKRIKEDNLYIEDEARKKLGLIRPDEKVFRLKEESETSTSEEPRP